jgi:YesN/AraC family two-component response regulator
MTGARILIVEDEILVVREIESHLNAMAYQVVGFALDADTALHQIAATVPDLVLMDINLQGELDGIAAAGEIHDRFQIPVIYVTAYADPGTLERAKVTHPSGYILKPFNQTDLRVAIELALFQHQAYFDHQPEAVTKISAADSLTEGLPPSKLRKVFNYVDNHLNQELSLEKLAGEIGLTSYYFARLFKQSTGQSFHQYVIRQRVERAKQLLQQSELSIAKIAVECGFANSSHLALHFKRIVGRAPKKFRFF